MSKKGTPKSRQAIEANIVRLKREARRAQLAAITLIVVMVAFMAIVQLTPVMTLLPIQGQGVLVLNIVVFMLIMLVSSAVGERAKVKKKLLRDQEALLERARTR